MYNFGIDMSERKSKLQPKALRMYPDGFTQKILEELMSTGDFKSISQLLQIAVINLYKDYEAKGKLRPPEDARERIKKAKLVEERDVETD